MARNYFINDPIPSLGLPTGPATAPTANEQGRIGDIVDAGQQGAISAFGGVFDFLGAEGIAQSLYGSAEEQRQQMSTRGQEAMSKSFFQEDDQGNFEAGEGLTDIDTWLLTMANVAGQFVGTGVPGGAGAKLASKALSLGTKGKNIANAVGMGATGGAAATGQGMEQARQEVENMPDSILAESPLFGDLFRGIHKNTPELTNAQKWDAAKKALADQVAQEVRTDPKVLLANFAASAIGDPIIGKALTGARLAKSGAFKSAAAGFITEGSTEAVQAGVQQVGINEALNPVDNRDSMKGVYTAALNEGVAGGGFGAAAGGFGGLLNRNKDTAPIEPPPVNEDTESVRTDNPGLAAAMDQLDAQSESINNYVPNYDLPTAARKAGFNTPAGAGEFGDIFGQDTVRVKREDNLNSMIRQATDRLFQENNLSPTQNILNNPGELVPVAQSQEQKPAPKVIEFEPGVKLNKNGKPYQSEKGAKNSKLARQAKRQGLNVVVVPVDGGYGWDIQQPEVKAETKKGAKAKVYSPSGQEIDAEYQIIDASDPSLVTSNSATGAANPNYPKELQPRNRDRASSIAQIKSIASNLVPERLGASNESDRGAPIVKNGIVESGNGRTAAITEAYKNGKAGNYKQYLIDNAKEFGLSAEDIQGMSAPILVRNRTTELTPDQRIAFTTDSNKSAGIELSPSELANSDATLLSDEDMALLSIADDGDILGAGNQSFINNFTKRMGNNESAKYRQADGSLNSQFAARVKNAIFAKSYNSPDLLADISESTSSESKNLMTALMNGAGKVSEVKGLDSSQGEALSGSITEAARLIIKSKRDGVPVSALVNQGDILGDQPAQEVAQLAELLNKNIRSAKKMSAILNSISEQMRVAAQNKSQVDLFSGEVNQQPTVEGVINDVTNQSQTQPAQDSGANVPGSNQDGQPASQAESVDSNAKPSTAGSRQGSKLDNAANAISDKKLAAAEKLRKLMESKKGQLNSGIDPEVMLAVAEVGALSIAEGAVKFAQWARDVLNTTRAVGLADDDVKPFLKEAYGAIGANPEKYSLGDEAADSMSGFSEIRKFDLNTIESDSDVSATSENVEQPSESENTEQEYQSSNDDESNGPEQVPSRTESNTTEGERSNGEPGISTDDGTIQGAPSTESLLNSNGSIGGDENASDTGNDGRSNINNDDGAQIEPGATAAIDEAIERVATDEKAQQTADNTSHSAKWGDESDILNSVPVLMPAQAGDIAKIENRFFGTENPGPGYQNTNGTGTGKTFVGLGVLKRFAQTGKTNALVAVPNDGIAQQWVQAAKEHFGLDVYLIGTDGGAKAKDPGRGITITTYATLGNNDQLIKSRDNFDLIIADESQNLMGSQQAKETNALASLRALTNHEEGSNRRARAYLTDEIEALDKKIKAKAKQLLATSKNETEALNDAKEFYQKERTQLNSQVQALATEFKKEGPTDSKVLFLSATPFPYVKNLDYAEGYLFNYTDYGDKFEGGYDNAFTGRNAFYIQNFGYRWRYHKLNTPGSEVDQSLMERQFHENMKEKGVLGGRTLEVDADYKRDFIKVETAAGEKLDDLIEKWRDHSVGGEGESETSERPYSVLADILNKTFDYTKKIKLTEAIKAEEAVNRAKAHIEKGRKVVLFHSYNVGGSFDPVEAVRQIQPELLQQFESEFPGMTNIDFGVLARPLDLFADEFGDSVRFYNGNVPDKARKEAKDLFNDDSSGVDVIVVQQEAGEAGISLHDVTGGKQRVLINIGMPVKPTQFIQIEGRIYRVGVKTDAQFENLTTGTAFERGIFASKIAGRASTAENLAMGEFARSLKENISEGYLDASYLPVGSEIGKGGKVSDRPTAIDDWDRAKTYYFANVKRNGDTKSAEGEDYFATPEPVGKKMVEWLQPLPGHRMLEPSVGHGAIGRWFPGTTRNKATEKSFKLSSLSQMNFPGDVENIPFEDLNVINKFEGVAMNPPFGKGGKLAYDHIRKAIKHLVNGGRIVALVPDGTAANKRLDALLTDEKLTNIYQAAEIDLPAGVFDRAGTGVKTKIVVLDRFDNSADAPDMQRISFANAKDINSLFDRIKDVEIRERKQPTPVEYDVTQYMDAASKPTKNRKGDDVYKIELYGYLPFEVKDVIDKEGSNEFGAIPTRDERVYTLDNDEARQDFANFIAQTIEEAKESGVKFDFKAPAPKPEKVRVEGQQSNEYFEATGDTYTTKRGKEFLVTEMIDRQERDTYAALKELAKDFGGWAQGQKFMFKTLDDITQFNAQAKALLDGGVNENGRGYQVSEPTSSRAPSQISLDFSYKPDDEVVKVDTVKTKRAKKQVNKKSNVQNVDVDFLTYSGNPVKTPEQAASAIAAIRKMANEQVTALVTDKAGNVLNVIRHSIGSNRSAVVDPASLAGSIVDIPGGEVVWLAHNHPTGNPTQSSADLMVTQKMAQILDGSGVELKGMITVGSGNKATYYDVSNEAKDYPITTIPSIRRGRVPVSERRIKGRKKLHEAIGSANDAQRMISAVSGGRNGIALLNTKLEAIEFMPLTLDEMSTLKAGKLRELLANVHGANASAAILSVNESVSDAKSAVSNIMALFKMLDVTIHDAINPNGGAQTWASSGDLPSPIGMFFSKEKGSNKAKGVSEGMAQSIANKFVESLSGANGIQVKILKDNAHAEQIWRMSLKGATVKGAYSSNTKTVYVIADNISNINDLKQTLAHEIIAHGGLDTAVTKGSYKQFIDKIKSTRGKKSFAKYWADADKDYAGESADVKAEEIFARFVENKPSKGELKYWFNSIKNTIKKILKAIGIEVGADTVFMDDMIDAITKGFYSNEFGPGNDAGTMYSKSRLDMNFKDVTKRTPELQEAAAKLKAGEITAAEYDSLVNEFKPVEAYTTIPPLASTIEMEEALNANKVPLIGEPGRTLSNGDKVGLRLDIPAYTNYGAWIVSVHQGKASGRGGSAGKAIGYESAAMINNPSFDMPEKPALMIATGKAKGTIATIGGDWINESPENISQLAQEALNDPSWVQVGMDPERHSYFYDRETMEPVLSGDQVIQVGGLVLLKNPTYGNKGDYLFSRTVDEDTRTAEEKLGFGPKEEETFASNVKAAAQNTASTLKDSSFWQRLNEGIFDGLAGIKQAEESVGINDPDRQGYVSARLASGLADVLHGVFNYGAPKWQDGIVQRKEDTKGLLEVFGGLGDDLDNWLMWMGANRAEALKAQGKENNLSASDIAELKAKAAGKEQLFEETRLEYNKINSAILDLAQQAGLLSQAQRSGFDEEYYVPFFRDAGDTDPEMDDIKRMIIEPHTRSGIAGQSAQIKAIKGGTQSTKDLLENIISRHSTMIDASLKNKAMIEVTDNLSGTDYMKEETSEDITSMSQQELNKVHRVKVMRNGKPVAYMVSDPSLLRALIHVNDVGSKSLFNKIGRSAKRFLTAGITLSPDFIFRNFVRDAAQAWMVNKDDFKFGTDSIKGLKKAFKEDEAYRDLIFSGAAFQGGYVHGADPEAGAQQVRRALRAKGLSSSEIKGYMDTLINSGGELIEKYRAISDKVENANRLSTYEAGLKAGKSRRQAAFEAKDLMDYSLKGNFALIGTMIDMLPFFNARLQGMSKLVRAGKAGDNDQVLKVLSANLAMKGAKVAAFSLALAAMNDDDERYQELADWDKDANWHFFAGEEHLRLPKPFELGIVFGTMPERLLHTATGTQTGGDLGQSVAHAVFNTLALNPIPQMALPFAEVMVNKSFFKDAPIEGMADENKQAQDRYNAYTSDTAKAIGDAFNVSPKKVEHLIKGYTGTIGGYVLGASDIMARQIMGVESADTPLSRYPVIKSFYQGSGPQSSTKFATEFYEALDVTRQAYGSYKRAMEEGDTSRQQELLEGQGEQLRSRIALNRVQRQASKLSKQARAVNDNNNLTGAEKREQLDNIQRQKNALYHKAYVTFNLGEW